MIWLASISVIWGEVLPLLQAESIGNTIDENSLKNKLIMGKTKVLPKDFKFTQPNNVGFKIGCNMRDDN